MWPFTRIPAAPPPAEAQRLLSILTPDQVRDIGHLPPHAVLGELRCEGTDQTFTPNPTFIALLHETIRHAGPDDPDIQRAATAQVDGWIYVIDLRTPDEPQGQVPIEDIIAGFLLAECGTSTFDRSGHDPAAAWPRRRPAAGGAESHRPVGAIIP